MPVTEPYVRRSEHGAAWFLARALRRLLDDERAREGRDRRAVRLQLHPRARYRGRLHAACRAVAALSGMAADGRRVRRARAAPGGARGAGGRCRDRRLHRRRYRERHAASATCSQISPHSRGRGVPVRRRRPERELRADHRRLYARDRRHARRISASSRWRSGPMRATNPLALLRRSADVGAVSERAPDRRAAASVRLRDALRRRRRFPGDAARARRRARSAASCACCGAIERHNAFPDDPVQLRGGWAMDRDALWTQAAIGPEDIDMTQTYDDYPVISMLQFEGLGFCAEGGSGFRAPPHIHGGRQLSAQHRRRAALHGPGRRGGRLSGPGGGAAPAGRQGDARHALVSGFGMINYDRGLCSAACVLAR